LFGPPLVHVRERRRSSIVDAEVVIRGELSPSERLLWAGRPRQGIVFRGSDWFAIPITILWVAFFVFAIINVITESPEVGAAVMGSIMMSLFLLVGIGFGVGRFLIDRWLRARTTYGISSERVLIVCQCFGRKVKSLYLETLTDLALTEYANGSGTIVFGPRGSKSDFYNQTGWHVIGWESRPLFELREGARRVHEMVRDARRAAVTTRTV
jgi:hypothetical protein